MNVCFVCSEYPPGPHGGIGTVTQILAHALRDAGHQVKVVGVYGLDYPAPDHENDHGVLVWRLREPAVRFGWMVARYRLFRMLSCWAQRGEIDLIELPDHEGWAAGWWRLPVPVIVRLHGSMTYFAAELGRPARRLAFLIERASLRRADFYCSVSRYTARQTQKLFGVGAADAVLHNGLPLPVGPPSEGRSPHRVVYTGTLTAKKGVVPLIRAWNQVHTMCPDAELHVFGKDGRTDQGGSMRAHLASQLTAESHSSVHFHGARPRPDVLTALATARLAVFPSYAEAFALAPLESMAVGCPTIYSTRGSGAELIDDQRDGLLIDPDRPEAIASAILRLLTDDDLARRLGQAGRQKVDQLFAIGTVAAANEAFYQRCVRDFKGSYRRTPRSGLWSLAY